MPRTICLQNNNEFDRGLGWMPELPDRRDFVYSARRVDKLDAAILIKPQATASRFRKAGITDQRYTSACVGHSTSRHWGRERSLTARSPLHPYWLARKYRGWEGQDEGCYIRDAFKMLSYSGCTRDDLYPDTDVNIFAPPSARAVDDADNRLPSSYYRIDSDNPGDTEQTRQRILSCISSGHSFVGGCTLYASFFSPRTLDTGMVLLPGSSEPELGGHAMDFGEYFIQGRFKESQYAQTARTRGFPESLIPDEVLVCANSWGTDYGQDGYFFWDLRYLTDRNLSDDLWTSRR